MLDAFIIEELKRREEERRRDSETSQPQLPVPSQPDREVPARQSDDEKPQRGVVIIDYSV